MGECVFIASPSDERAAALTRLLEQGGYAAVRLPAEGETLRQLVALGYRTILLDAGGGMPSLPRTAGPFVYDPQTLRLYKNGHEIPLTGKENAIMRLFIENPGRVFSRDMLYDRVWGNALTDDNAVTVYISRLRRKIEDDPARPRFIRSERGLGYRFSV